LLDTSLLHDDIREKKLEWKTIAQQDSSGSGLTVDLTGSPERAHRKQNVRGQNLATSTADFRDGLPDSEDNAEAETIGLQRGVDELARRSRKKPRRIVVVPQVPKLILEVNHTKIQGSVLMVVHAAAELVDDTIVCLTTMVRKVARADHKVAIGPKLLINVV
jgi:hypothetical protein